LESASPCEQHRLASLRQVLQFSKAVFQKMVEILEMLEQSPPFLKGDLGGFLLSGYQKFFHFLRNKISREFLCKVKEKE